MTAPIVVIGDVMLDVDVIGKSVRQSPEAPVPVLNDLAERHRPGGAALAALLAGRGERPVVLIAPMATDDAAITITDLLAERVEVVSIGWSGTTPVKTRIRAGDHPVARLDTGGLPGVIDAIPARAFDAVETAAAVLVSDYGMGTTGDPAMRAMIAAAADRAPVIWDPHPRGFPAVPGVSLVVPNESEMFGFLDRPVRATSDGVTTSDDVASAGDTLRLRWEVDAVCVTRGSRGALLVAAAGTGTHIPATPVIGSDTCGAGDSFAAAVTTGLADGRALDDAVRSAVAAAGRFVAAGGAAGVDPRARDAGSGLDGCLDDVRSRHGVVVATGGCFDLLHAGHVATLEAARSMGDFLVVCLNSDASVRRLKGPGRPLQTAAERSRMLMALQCVDAVVTFDEDTPVDILCRLEPAIWVKGGDYAGRDLPEAAAMATWGGRVVTLPYLDGFSTTSMVARAARSVVT